MGPSLNGTAARHLVSLSRVMVAHQRHEVPEYFTTAQAVDPETWLPTHSKVWGCFMMGAYGWGLCAMVAGLVPGVKSNASASQAIGRLSPN